MLVSCTCCTYNRPQMLRRTVECFELQTYAPRELLILDDAGQYHDFERWWVQDGKPVTVKLRSFNRRSPTFGDKRNACVAMASPDAGVYVVMDDDDVYWPEHIAAVIHAMRETGQVWTQSRRVYETAPDGRSNKVCCASRPDHDWPAYGGCWAWRKDAFHAVGEYESKDTDDDTSVARRLKAKYGDSADTLCDAYPTPTYWYNRAGGKHISDIGNGFWALRGAEETPFVGEPQPGLSPSEIYDRDVIPGVHLRPWDDPELKLGKTGDYVWKR